MKFFAVFASLLLSVSAFALNSNSSWEEIADAHYQYTIDPVSEQTVIDGVAVSIFNLCDAGTELRTIEPITYCAQPGRVYIKTPFVPQNNSDNVEVVNVCGKYVTRTLVGGNTKSLCKMYAGKKGNRHCVDSVIVAKEPTTTYSVDVLYAKSGHAGDVAFSKSYTLPACPQF